MSDEQVLEMMGGKRLPAGINIKLFSILAALSQRVFMLE